MTIYCVVILFQVYRLQNQVELAIADLDTAIQLSQGHGKVAEQAHTQRGLIPKTPRSG